MLFFLNAAYAEDVITMKDGSTYRGSILFHTEHQYWISVDGEAKQVPILDIQKIDLSGAAN